MNQPILPKGIKLWIQEGAGAFHYAWYPGYATVIIARQQLDFSYNFNLTIIKDRMFFYAYDEPDGIRVSKIVAQRQAKDKNYTKKLIADWQVRVDKMYDLAKQIDKINLAKFSDRELADLFRNFSNLYLEEFAIPILGDMVSYFCEVELTSALKKHLKKLGQEKEFNKYLTVLSQLTDNSFIVEEKYELLKIVKDYQQGKEIDDQLAKHAQKWHWLQNNYAGAIILDKNYFRDRAKEHAKDSNIEEKLKDYPDKSAKIKAEKEKIITELGLDEKTKLIITLAEEFGYWQDVRKRANLIATHYLTLFLKEISRRKKIAFEDMEATYRDEVLAILEGRGVDWEIIKLRKKIAAAIFTPEKAAVYNYQDSLKLLKEVQAQSSLEGSKTVFGTVANIGKVVGPVRIIMNPDEFYKMKQGDILVTSMTRPDFMPILKKAAAIVTNEGGITCHAAIVSRELNIPCIIGTKIATKVFKDGDMVEVNANHGAVNRVE